MRLSPQWALAVVGAVKAKALNTARMARMCFIVCVNLGFAVYRRRRFFVIQVCVNFFRGTSPMIKTGQTLALKCPANHHAHTQCIKVNAQR
jgi:hypothetical protein